MLMLWLFTHLMVKGQGFVWQNPNLKKDSIARKDSLKFLPKTAIQWPFQKANKKDSLVFFARPEAYFEKDFFSRDTVYIAYNKRNELYDEVIFKPKIANNGLGQLQAKGSVIRGLSFGNNQGTSAQSSMEMQITGKLSQDLSLIASVADHNLPTQQDGYTQSLQEFDRVMIQVNYKDAHWLKAGHLELSEQNSHFAKYQRRAMGLQALVGFKTDRYQSNLMLSGGVARAEFHRISFQGTDGNQGPYRLPGKNAELFVQIISGSEQVFMDGILLKRGENLDYTVNYNTGELTFTSFRPVFRQNQLVISYNYSLKNYTRYLSTAQANFQNKQLKIKADWFLETDDLNAPLDLNFNDKDKKQLVLAGNNPQLMYSDSAVPAAYDVNKILYKKINQATGDYYEYSNDSSQSLYQLSFTQFGAGLGDYSIKSNISNGRVFEYVGPGLGDYKAVKKLVAPERNQVLSLAAEFKPNATQNYGFDVALSQRDFNLFSSKDNEQNLGHALRFYGQNQYQIDDWLLSPKIELQHLQRNFSVLDRINDVQFSRDFNLSKEFNQINQNRLTFVLDNHLKNWGQINYQFNLLNEAATYQGLKHDLKFDVKNQNINYKGLASVLKTKGAEMDSDFYKANASAAYQQKKHSAELGFGLENNQKKNLQNHNLEANSFAWKELFAQHRYGDSLRTIISNKFYVRLNDSAQANRLINQNKIVGWQLQSDLIKKQNTSLSIQWHYRKMMLNPGFYQQIQDQAKLQQNQDFVLGNINYQQSFFNRAINFQAFYELGNGQEALRQYQYLKVTDGRGIYKWTDYNKDGIQQLDEFEKAEYQDQAQYIRVFTPQLSYVASNKNKLQSSFQLVPYLFWEKPQAWLKRINLSLSFLSQNAYLKGDDVLVWNPFAQHDAALLKTQNTMAVLNYFALPTASWFGQYKYQQNKSINNNNLNLEERLQESHFINLGYKFSPLLRLEVANQHRYDDLSSAWSNNRNYQIAQWDTSPKLIYQVSAQVQASLTGIYKIKTRLDGPEHLKNLEANALLQYERDKTNLRGSYSLIKNQFDGSNFSMVANQMLEGLKEGFNQVWSLTWQQKLNSFLSLNVLYEGRKNSDKTIHTGSCQIKANF